MKAFATWALIGLAAWACIYAALVWCGFDVDLAAVIGMVAQWFVYDKWAKPALDAWIDAEDVDHNKERPMGQVVQLKDVHNMADLPAVINDDPWQTATEGKRKIAALREALVLPLVALVNGGASINNAARMMVARVDAGNVDQRTRLLLGQVGRDAMSVPTLKRWISAYLKDGKVGLLPGHTGRVRKEYGWEARAIELYNLPGKPGYADVLFCLIKEGYDDVNESRVARYLKSLPATLGKYSPARVGKHLHKLTRQKYQRRNLDEVLVGEIYVGDGHTADVYVAHPNTGKPFRPELTVFIDLKTRYVVGWWMTESESAVSTLFALSHAMTTFDHVPAWLYIDRGAGYRAKMLCDENVGWYSRFGMDVIGALPGNPHGKGWIERFFRTARDKCDKFFANGQVYCGDDMAPEINRRLSAELAQGKRKLPSLDEYIQAFNEFLNTYHHMPMEVLGGKCPAEMWKGLEPVRLGVDVDAVMRPSEDRMVRRQTVSLHKRTYFHEALALYDAQRVLVDYDLHNDAVVWVRTLDGKFIAEAKLVNTIGVLPTSRLEEQREKRLDQQLKRLEIHADEARARRQDAITSESQVKALEDLGQVIELPNTNHLRNNLLGMSTPTTPTDDDEDFDLDITTWRDDQ